jgi:hypothetical protein
MSAFLSLPNGSIQPINGTAGTTVKDLTTANQGTPGRDVIVNVVNQIHAATQIRIPPNACDPQAALQRAQQQFQQRVQQILENHILQEVQNEVAVSPTIKSLQEQLQNLQSQEATESITQQAEIIQKDIESQLNTVIIGVIGRAAVELPQVTKVANSTAAGIKTVASVAESLATFVPSQGINMSAYGSVGQKGIQTVSQACSI